MIFKTMTPSFSRWTKTSLKETAELKVTPGRAGTQSLRDLSPTTAPSQNTAHGSSHTLEPTIPSVAIVLPEKQRAADLGWGQVGCVHSLHPCWDLEEGAGASNNFPCASDRRKGREPQVPPGGHLSPFSLTDPRNPCCCTHVSDGQLRPREGPGHTSLPSRAPALTDLQGRARQLWDTSTCAADAWCCPGHMDTTVFPESLATATGGGHSVSLWPLQCCRGATSPGKGSFCPFLCP